MDAAIEAPPAAMDESRLGFLRLVEAVLPAAHRLARAMLDGRAEAEDAVQEAVVKAWRHFDRFDATRPVEPWLLAIVANECRSARRSRWWSFLPLPSGASTTKTETASAEVADLRRALRRLPHEQRLLIVLRYYLDQSFDDIGLALGISPGAAKSRTFRALKRLRVELPEETND